MSSNITWHDTSLNADDYRKLNGHHSGVIWLTGLSGSGKSSIANRLNQLLYEKKIHTYLLDGDNVRHGLNKDLGFSSEDRVENIRRIGEVANLFADSGKIVITAFISPYQKDRDRVRNILPKGDFIEVHVDCPIEECEKRDPKGLYQKARNGEINGFTGIDAPYESPSSSELTLHTDRADVNECALQLVSLLEDKGWI
ncbi:adenylyl-sulfate kinase [Halobacillus mangrovi]|uniref:Adenylyl-sulfate kinase n=1 Tax=Halobacillus mangrovi TaxID=402384 RepID=A0A1W5ZVS5_9BACI|nr:adenylyl-sulfate kinase [Halobacillus mangrovi]ARI77395.1 adenylyl-sulfate kinase [Halobacillus mangrovi]